MELKKITEYLWEIPKTGGMRVPGRIYANDQLLEGIRGVRQFESGVSDTAHLSLIEQSSKKSATVLG